jgi:hypothetical protein
MRHPDAGHIRRRGAYLEGQLGSIEGISSFANQLDRGVNFQSPILFAGVVGLRRAKGSVTLAGEPVTVGELHQLLLKTAQTNVIVGAPNGYVKHLSFSGPGC